MGGCAEGVRRRARPRSRPCHGDAACFTRGLVAGPLPRLARVRDARPRQPPRWRRAGADAGARAAHVQRTAGAARMRRALALARAQVGAVADRDRDAGQHHRRERAGDGAARPGGAARSEASADALFPRRGADVLRRYGRRRAGAGAVHRAAADLRAGPLGAVAPAQADRGEEPRRSHAGTDPARPAGQRQPRLPGVRGAQRIARPGSTRRVLAGTRPRAAGSSAS